MKKKKKDRVRRKEVDSRWEERSRRKGKRRDERLRSKERAYKGREREGVKGRRRGKRERKEKEGRLGGKKTEVRNRCVDTGNGRSVLRWFRKSGRQVRERARKGKLEGVYRASW